MGRCAKIWILLFVCFSFSFSSQSQFRKKKKLIVIEAADTLLPDDVVLNIYNFENVNRFREYKSEYKLDRIRRLEKQENWPRLHVALKDYIKRFGIQNFYRDTKLIWRLAKISELIGNEEEATALYRLVLRHHHEGIDMRQIELYYDSLNTQIAEQFVPVDYYYELVEHRQLIDTLRPPRGVLLNMGTSINSSKADYGPTINVENGILLFTSKRNNIDLSIARRDNEDLFFSLKDDYGTWSTAKPLDEINSRYNEGSAFLSKDGKTLFFSRCDCPNCYGDCDIFYTEMEPDSTWGDVKNLGVNVNSLSWDSHPSLNHTGDTLYFSSDRLGGFGLADIYFTYMQKDGEWAPAQNLGPVINTRNNEVSPFYHPDNEVLYFSSNGQLYSFGEYDIYKTYRIEGDWSEPENIGPLVNGRGSEFYFTIDSKSNQLYYSRSPNRNLNTQDLYSFPLPMEAQPGASTSLSGSLTDSLTGEPFKGIVTVIDLDQGIEVSPRYLKPDGSFEFNLIDKRNYLLVIQGDDFFRVEEAFFLDGPLQLNKITEPITTKVKFESIEFETGKADLLPGMYGDLNKVVNFLYDNIDFKLRIGGHTDSMGSESVNLRLSKERAKVIRDYIVIFAGINERRVEFEGYGSSQPIVAENNAESRRINRRVEFEIYRPALTQENPLGDQN